MNLLEELSLEAKINFEQLTPSEKKLFEQHVNSAKTEKMKAKKIIQVEEACLKGYKNLEINIKEVAVDEKFVQYFAKFDEKNVNILIPLLNHLETTFKELKKHYAWNTPMYTLNNTFIISFAMAKNHFSVAVEDIVLNNNRDKIQSIGYETTQKMFKIKYDQEINIELIDELVKEQILIKNNCQTFWLK